MHVNYSILQHHLLNRLFFLLWIFLPSLLNISWPYIWELISGLLILFHWFMCLFLCWYHTVPKKGNAKECSNYHTIALITHTSKVMLKILQARLQQYVNRELLDVQALFRKGRGSRDQIANIFWIIEKAREFQKKHLFLLYWLYQSLWLCGSP